MKIAFALGLVPILGWSLFLSSAHGCSCEWKGPFLTVAKNSPLVVRAKIIRHHSSPAPIMDVLALETLKGGLLDSGLVIRMGDGMHCRPTLDLFHPGSEWVLALNGPGSKPGKGFAISRCGEHWLAIDRDDVVGLIEGEGVQQKRMPLRELKRKLLYPRFTEAFSGRVRAGEHYRHSFGLRFEFVLESTATGWTVVIRELGRNEDLSRFTPPLHSAPNPREIEGWHLLDKASTCPSRPYKAEAGPGNLRRFIFSPDVGGRIDGPKAGRSVTTEEIEEIRHFGRGMLTIENFGHGPGGAEGCPGIAWMTFSVQIEGGY